MSAKINFAFPVNAILAGFHHYLFDRLTMNSKLLENKRLVIFGAGTRGSELLFVLKGLGYKNIIFCDNNTEKQKGYINDYPIYSFLKVLGETEDQVFLVPIENNEIVINQLEEAGLEENIGFLNLDFDLYDDYLREFLRPAVNHVVIFGDCAFSHVSICDKDKHSLADMIKEKHGEEKCKSLVMHGMGTRSFYHIFRALLRRNEKPRKVLFEVTPMMLAPKAYLMPRTQHPALIGKILSATKEPGADLIEYASLTQERFNKLRSESAVSFQESKNDDIIKLYMKMNYMHTIKEDNERIVYLKKLIEELNTIGIPVSLYIPPVNYKYGEKLLGGDFTVYYKEMFSSLWGFLDGLNYDALDASFLLDEIDFSLENNHDETANYAGRLKLLNFLEAFIEEA